MREICGFCLFLFTKKCFWLLLIIWHELISQLRRAEAQGVAMGRCHLDVRIHTQRQPVDASLLRGDAAELKSGGYVIEDIGGLG